MIIQYSGQTETGRIRNHNEDNLYVEGYVRELSQECFACEGKCTTENTATFAVCDGISGARSGEIASFIVAKRLVNTTLPDSPDGIAQLIQTINNEVCSQLGIREGQEAGTTFTGLQLQDAQFTVWNVGDSRVYLLRDGRLYQLTEDHTHAQQMLKAGFISKESAKTDPARHVLTQYIGVPEEDCLLSPDIHFRVGLKQGDRFLLCTDGLYEMVSVPEIMAILQTGDNANATVDHLVHEALDAGGKDNITVILVDVQGE